MGHISSSQLRSQAEDCLRLVKRWANSSCQLSNQQTFLQMHWAICPFFFLHSIPTMLLVHSEQLNKTGFPTIHAVVLLEGTMNMTGEPQPLVEQLMMVKRMQVCLGQGRFARFLLSILA